MKSCTDLGQSKKLAEILQLEGADMYYSRDETTYAKTLTKYDITHANVLYGSCDIQYFNIREWTPCWSLAALLDILPLEVSFNRQTDGVDTYYYIASCDARYCDVYTHRHINVVDACYEMVTILKERNLI